MNPPAFADTQAAATAFLESQLTPLWALSDRIRTMYEEGQRLEIDALRSLEPPIREALQDMECFVGHGFVAAPGVAGGLERFLTWWQRRDDAILPLNPNLLLSDPDVYDYAEMDWFAGPQRTHKPVIYGPYLDYAGSNHFVLTVTVPVLAGDHFLGVAGADLLANKVEERLTQIVLGGPRNSLIATAEHTIVASASPHSLPGERLTRRGGADRRIAVELPLGDWTGWILAVGPEQ